MRMDKVVVFPAPLCPRRTVICPSYKFKDKSFTAIRVLFFKVNFCKGKTRTNLITVTVNKGSEIIQSWRKMPLISRLDEKNLRDIKLWKLSNAYKQCTGTVSEQATDPS